MQTRKWGEQNNKHGREKTTILTMDLLPRTAQTMQIPTKMHWGTCCERVVYFCCFRLWMFEFVVVFWKVWRSTEKRPKGCTYTHSLSVLSLLSLSLSLHRTVTHSLTHSLTHAYHGATMRSTPLANCSSPSSHTVSRNRARVANATCSAT
jgi:hypothetical protein